MPSRPRHQNKDLEKVLKLIEEEGWRVTKGKKYFKIYCPCGKDLRSVALTPSTTSYSVNLVKWIERRSCWKAER